MENCIDIKFYNKKLDRQQDFSIIFISILIFFIESLFDNNDFHLNPVRLQIFSIENLEIDNENLFDNNDFNLKQVR